MNEIELMTIGINKNEAIVYLALLKKSPCSAGTIIKETELHRNIVYDNLEKLIDKGLASYIIEGKKKIFQINSTSALTQMLEKEQESLNKKKDIARELEKQLHRIVSQQKDNQEANIFRGVKGLKLLMKDTLDEGKEYVVFGAPQESLEIMGESYWQNYNLKREEKNISIRMVFNEDLRKWSKNIASKRTKIKFLEKKFDSITETMIFGNKTAIIIWTEKPLATVIKDKNLAKSYKQYFEFLWSMSKK